MLHSKSFEFIAAVCGFQVYRNVWPPQLNENLDCCHEEGNLCDIFAVITCHRTCNEIVEHLTREISRPTKYLIDRGAVITAALTTDRYRRSPLYQGGLKIPCNLKVIIADTEKFHLLLNAYWELELMSKLYCEPVEVTSVASFIEPESDVNLLPKRKKVRAKKTPLPKTMNIKIVFMLTKILSHQEKDDEIEIDPD